MKTRSTDLLATTPSSSSSPSSTLTATRVSHLLRRVPRVGAALVVPAAVVMVGASGAWGSTPKPTPMKPATKAEWIEDIDYFARELPKRHVNAFHTVTKEKFEAAVVGLKAAVPTATDDQILVGLMRITAMVGDGHTGLRFPSNTHQFPIGIAVIEGAYRIVRGAGPAAALVGGKLTRVDDTPLEDAVKQIGTIQSQAESDELIAAFTPQWFSVAEVLHGLGIARSAESARFAALMDDGSERVAEVAALPAADKPQWKAAAASQPLYRQKGEEGFWYTWLEDSGTVYVNFRRYDDLRAESRELWAFVDGHPVTKIAIDLRQNGGGDFNVGRKYLVDELAQRPKIRGYVIIGPRTFSAAMKNAIDFRTVAHATLVGETIGEKPNSYSENDEMTLPHTKLVFSYSTKYYKFLPEGGLVTPDKTIEPTWAEWLAGKDPVLDWIVSQ